uniref:Uncharacterized protein n=1 Tax=Romanomermis culicivorax TaxID=13658 RepID=A0A915JB25_ROMCU
MAAPQRRPKGAPTTSGTTLTGLLTIGNCKPTTDVKNNGAQLKPILENILDREKQNQEDTKEETIKDASSDVNDLKNALKDFRQSLSRTSPDLDPTSMDALLKTLNDLLAQEKDSVERLEKEKNDCLEKGSKISQPESSPVDEEKVAALKDSAKKYRDTADDLKKLLRNCTKSINNAIGPDGNKEASNIEEALQKICDLADILKEKRQEYDRSKAKLVKSDKEKQRLHQLLKNRLESRRPLEGAPNRLALEMEQVARKRSSWPLDCGQPAPVPERGDDLVSSLTHLYEWAEKELARGERALKSKSAGSPAVVDADDGRKKLTDKDEELNRLSADIAKQGKK